jgi:hypothetical protein
MDSEITQVINQQAHTLAAMLFAAIRLKLREQAKAMLKEKKPIDEVIRVIQATGLPGEALGPWRQLIPDVAGTRK